MSFRRLFCRLTGDPEQADYFFVVAQRNPVDRESPSLLLAGKKKKSKHSAAPDKLYFETELLISNSNYSQPSAMPNRLRLTWLISLR